MSLVPLISTKKSLVIVEKDGIEVKLGQESSPIPTPQTQGEAQQEVRQDDKFEELKVTIALEEQIVI